MDFEAAEAEGRENALRRDSEGTGNDILPALGNEQL